MCLQTENFSPINQDIYKKTKLFEPYELRINLGQLTDKLWVCFAVFTCPSLQMEFPFLNSSVRHWNFILFIFFHDVSTN